MINEDDEIKEFVTRFLEAGIQGKEAKMGLDAALGAVELLAATALALAYTLKRHRPRTEP